MSWLFSRALVEEYSEEYSSDGLPSAPLNVMPTQHKFSRNGKMIKPSDLSRFGLTCEVLTEDLGRALWTWSLAASPAPTFPPQAPEPESTAKRLDFGEKWLGSFATWDRNSSTWKTAQCSLLGDSDEFSETWPRWGSMRNGGCYLRPTWVPSISASASGFWQTPVADDAVNRVEGKWNSRGEPKLSAELKLWPTPRANDAEKRGNFDLQNPRNGLPAAARKWPTPVASANKGSSPASLVRKSGKSRENDRIDHAVMASDGGQLNPEWVEWLMGWPIGWTELKPLEMDKFHEWQQQHGGS